MSTALNPALDPALAAHAVAGTLTTTLKQSGRYRDWHPDWEVEAKLAITDPDTDPTALLWRILGELPPLLIDRVSNGETTVYPRYLIGSDDTGAEVEYSYFTWRNAPLLKIKQHTVDTVGAPVMVSTERFRYDQDAAQWAAESGGGLSEPLEKRRSKVLAYDADGFCYTVAVTVCVAGDRVQRQLEIEYEASEAARDPGSLVEVAEQVRRAAQRIQHHSPVPLEPTTETKYEFFQEVSR
ncbi:hypothetical protein [Nocardia terpenica]|uniref:Uncharacterized protein n=1 Tax=Nocardia terpenica TaxID=455432 RepID=A0A291RZ16_9NOCA|nr:hypothetical protein [Nocardia terpenica]ATL72522.1 hypothetical protein CRH09_39825 [Nocardia terpenica]